MSPSKWIEGVDAIGMVVQAGRYGGTYARNDIAFKFASWLSVEFELYLAKLSALNRPALLFYVSDHGESPRSGGWRNLQDPDCWEVPMFVWFSDQYSKAYPRVVSALRDSASKPLQLDTLLYGLVELYGLTGTYPPARSFLCD